LHTRCRMAARPAGPKTARGDAGRVYPSRNALQQNANLSGPFAMVCQSTSVGGARDGTIHRVGVYRPPTSGLQGAVKDTVAWAFDDFAPRLPTWKGSPPAVRLYSLPTEKCSCAFAPDSHHSRSSMRSEVNNYTRARRFAPNDNFDRTAR
jgi:hypothetical protein